MVTLCNFTEEGQEACHPFWPTNDGEKVVYGTVAVKLQATTSYDQFVTRKFVLQDSKVYSRAASCGCGKLYVLISAGGCWWV